MLYTFAVVESLAQITSLHLVNILLQLWYNNADICMWYGACIREFSSFSEVTNFLIETVDGALGGIISMFKTTKNITYGIFMGLHNAVIYRLLCWGLSVS